MPRRPTRTPPQRFPRRRAVWLVSVGVLLLVWFVVPFIALKVLNRSLNRNPDYVNHVEGLTLNPLAFGYTLREFSIRRKLGDTLVPVFTARSIVVSLEANSLARGKLRGKARIEAPQLHLVAQFFDPGRRKKPGAWQRIFNRFYLFPIDRIAVRDGAIRFVDYAKHPPVTVHLDAFEGEASGLTAARGRDSTGGPARLRAQGRFMSQAPVRIEASLRPSAPRPTFDLRARLDTFRLAELNGAFRAYAGLDVERGTLAVSARLRAREGRFEGVLHREARDLEIFDPETDNEGFLRSAAEAVADAAARLVERRARPEERPDVPVSGSFVRDAETWSAIGGVLRGAFVRALDPRLGKPLGEDAGIRWDSPEGAVARRLLREAASRD